jgi:hypothetical protein
MLDEIRTKLSFEFLNVTDLPAGNHGQYHYLPGDEMAVRDYRGAAAGLLNASSQPLFWRRLAQQVRMHRVARCHGCTAFSADAVQAIAAQHGLHVYICGVPQFDHHIALLSSVEMPGGTEFNSGDGGHQEDVVVDLWQYNINRQLQGSKDLGILADVISQHPYTKDNLTIKVFVKFD